MMMMIILNSSEDFKTSNNAETDLSLNRQPSLRTLPHSEFK